MSTFDKILEGLKIFSMYHGARVESAHDEILAGADHEVSEDDAMRLRDLGWRQDREGGWSRFT